MQCNACVVEVLVFWRYDLIILVLDSYVEFFWYRAPPIYLNEYLLFVFCLGRDPYSCSTGFRNVFASAMPFMFLSRSGTVVTTAIIERVLVLMQELTWCKTAVCVFEVQGQCPKLWHRLTRRIKGSSSSELVVYVRIPRPWGFRV